MRASFISGNRSASTSLIPRSRATISATGLVSPVSRTLRMPMRLSASIARRASGRTVSAITIAPSRRPSRATKTSDEVSRWRKVARHFYCMLGQEPAITDEDRYAVHHRRDAAAGHVVKTLRLAKGTVLRQRKVNDRFAQRMLGAHFRRCRGIQDFDFRYAGAEPPPALRSGQR